MRNIPKKIISVLLDQQEQILREEIAEGQKKLSIIETIKRELKEIENFSVESIGDIAHIMKQNNNLAKMRWITVLTGIPVTALQWTSIVLWITHGLWWLFGRVLQFRGELSCRSIIISMLPIFVPNATRYSDHVSRKCFGHIIHRKCAV